MRVNGVAPGIAPTRLRGIDALGQDRCSGHLTGTVINADSGLSIRGLAAPGGRVDR